MLQRILIFSILFLLLSASFSFAGGFQKLGVRLEEFYRYDLRQDDGQLFNTRISSNFNYLDTKETTLFKVTPFFEIRRNINRDSWERKELGVEIGRDIFPSFYIGEAIQAVWLREDYRNYTRNKRRDTAESETRLCFSRDILNSGRIKVKAFILGEYTYDFDIGSGVRNELTTGVIIPLAKYLQTCIDWRHIDRIHDFDSDTLETSLALLF